MRRFLVFLASTALLASSACSCDGDNIQRTSGVIELGTGVVNFGKICVGDSGIYHLPVINAGTVPLNISAVSVAGTDAFAVESYPERLAPAGQADSEGEIRITFTPSGEGEFFGDLVVESDDLERPTVQARLNGTGDAGARVDVTLLCPNDPARTPVACEMDSDCPTSEYCAESECRRECPAALNFGDVGVGLTEVMELTLTNLGCALVNVSEVQITALGGGGAAPGYSLSAPELPFNITDTQRETVSPALSPTAADTYLGTLSIDWRDAGEDTPGQTTINMAGTGVEVNLLVQPRSFVFADATVDTPQSRVFRIENAGGLAGEILSVSLRDGDPEFTITELQTLPFSIPAFSPAVDVFEVTYAPDDGEPDEDAVIVETNLGTLPSVRISGGAVPQIEVDPPTNVDFGTVATGGSATQDISVSNVGQANLTIYDLTFDAGTPAGVFSVAAAPPMPHTLGPTQSFTFTVNFQDDPGIGKDGTGAGQSETGTLEIVNDDPAWAFNGGKYLLALDTDTRANFGPTAVLQTFVEGTECFSQPCPLDATQNEVASFDASNSTDPETDGLTYLWELVSSPGGAATLTSTNTPSTQLTPDFPGRWEVRVTVTDPFGNDDTATSELSVSCIGC